MKPRSLAIFAILLATAPCAAGAQSPQFRDGVTCPKPVRFTVCVAGTIPKGTQVTMMAKGWKSPAIPKATFANDNPESDVKTMTRLQVSAPPPADAEMIAVLSPPDTVNEVSLREIQDDSLVARIDQYIKKNDALNLHPDIRLLKTRLLRASPTVLLSETYLSSPEDVAALEKQVPSGCIECEKVPLLVGATFEDLFKEARSNKSNSVEETCGGIKLAYTLSGRLHLLSHAFSCASDSFSATLIHDLSGSSPKLVFKRIGGL